MDRTVKNIFKNSYEKGISLLESLVATAIVGIGFVAVFQIVNYSTQSILLGTNIKLVHAMIITKNSRNLVKIQKFMTTILTKVRHIIKHIGYKRYFQRTFI